MGLSTSGPRLKGQIKAIFILLVFNRNYLLFYYVIIKAPTPVANLLLIESDYIRSLSFLGVERSFSRQSYILNLKNYFSDYSKFTKNFWLVPSTVLK